MGPIRFERHLQQTFLIMGDIKDELINEYSGQIVLRGLVRGLVKCKVVNIDGSRQLQYDISSEQDLLTSYSTKKLGFEDLINIIGQLIEILYEMEKYLMEGIQLILSPEYVFIDLETRKIKIIYDFSERKIKSDIAKFGEFLIDRVDHDDSKATSFAYYFFELSQSGNFNVKKIEEYMEKINAKEETRPYQLYDEDAVTEVYEDENEKESFLLSYESSIGNEEVETPRKEIKKKIKGKQRTKESFWKKIFNRKRKVQEPEYEEYQEDYYEIPATKDSKSEDSIHTVYVGKSALDRKYMLLELKRNKEIPHEIDSYPYTIGSKKNQVSLCLKDSSVSRIHGKITNQDGNIYYEDMHSTNGTLINDMPILPHEKIRIKRGDLISIGKTEFEFR